MHHTNMGYPSCISHVSLETVDRIRRVEYIDLAILLPPKSISTGEPAPKRFRIDEEGALSVTSAPKGKIENLATWTEAWSIFSLIAIRDQPRCAAALMQHQIRMVQAAGKYRFSAVVDYDTRARQALSKDPSRSLAELDTELFATCFTGEALPNCSICKKVGHLAGACTLAFRGKQAKESASTKSTEICRRYNHGACSGPCRFRHACLFCSGSHAVSACPAKK